MRTKILKNKKACVGSDTAGVSINSNGNRPMMIRQAKRRTRAALPVETMKHSSHLRLLQRRILNLLKLFLYLHDLAVDWQIPPNLHVFIFIALLMMMMMMMIVTAASVFRVLVIDDDHNIVVLLLLHFWFSV